MNITGYRTNDDHTQTLAWEERADGSVICDHDAARCCDNCIDADERLMRRGGKVVVRYWPTNAIREGRAVRFISLAR